MRGKGQVSFQSVTVPLGTSHQDRSGKWECLFLPGLLSCLPPASRNGNIIKLMPPYETFTAFWMLSTFLLNWMFANKSHGAGGWHDSPSASLGVILPCNAQGKQICIQSLTNLAVCFHWAGVHIIYFSPPNPFPFLSLFPFLPIFTPLIMHLFWEPVNVLFYSHPSRKYIFIGFSFLGGVKETVMRYWQCWLRSRF